VHERLAIVGVSSGDQPLHNSSLTISLCVNGEIYNHKYLRQQLDQELGSTLPYATHSDCEVIIQLYQHKQPLQLCQLLDGMFSFVITDTEKERIIIARDPIGITSLYYGWTEDGTLMVASEYKALEGLCTRFEEFPPGHVYISDSEQPMQRYYNPIWLDEKYLPTAIPDLDILRSSFERSVIKRIEVCDVPYGVLLSGGLDSSLVAAVAARHAKSVQQICGSSWSPRLHSFAIGVNGSSDLVNAQIVADFLGTIHHSWQFTVQQGIDALRDVIYHTESYDVPTIRASTPMYLLSRRIKALGVKMVLSGEGSDEVFGGYLYFHKAPSPEEFHGESVRKISKLHCFDCLRANKSTMACGIEARVPFLDKDFLEVAMSIDPAYKMVNGKSLENDPRRAIEKYIIRKAFDTPDNPYLPDEILWRQKEQFADGVGYSWGDSLRALADSEVSDEQFAGASELFPHNTPKSKEAYYYRTIFQELFPSDSAQRTVEGGPSVGRCTSGAIQWDPSFQSNSNPSGRAIVGVHVSTPSV
jgi:asparagine synthase (glutamine-hydrolysing)